MSVIMSACYSTFVIVMVLIVCATGTQSDPLNALGALLPPTVGDSFDELVKAASITCEAIPLEKLTCCSSMKIPSANIVEFRQNSRRVYRVTSAHEYLDISLRTLVLYVPGWWNTPTDESSTTLVKSLLKKYPEVLVLDTRTSFCRGYVSSVLRVQPFAHLLHNFIKRIHNAGFDIASIHIIGFSLGAHVAGVTGKLVQKALNKKIGRITALDPAKPCFTKIDNKVNKHDADFVQVIHTSTGILGIKEPVGHVDVYVNGVDGKQPECKGRSITLECDHAQAWRVFSASVTKPLVGSQCVSWGELVANSCSGERTIIGFSCSPKTRGIFLYKSEERKKRQETHIKIYNPFNFLKIWPFT